MIVGSCQDTLTNDHPDQYIIYEDKRDDTKGARENILEQQIFGQFSY